MLDDWERIVKVMQERFPLLVIGRFAEAHRVILQRAPSHQQDVLVRLLQATLQVVAQLSGHARDDGLRLNECRFECVLFAGDHLQDSDFQHVILHGYTPWTKSWLTLSPQWML